MSSLIKKLKQLYLLDLLAIMAVLYLMGAFIHLSFNIAKWDILTRIIISLAIIIVLFLITIMSGKKGTK